MFGFFSYYLDWKYYMSMFPMSNYNIYILPDFFNDREAILIYYGKIKKQRT